MTHCADEMHMVDEVEPPPDAPLLLYWDSNGDFCRGRLKESTTGKKWYVKHEGGGCVTPSRWAFFHPPQP